MFAPFRQIWSSWKRDKGLALLAMAALAGGMGCATAIFTVVDAVLLRPLPYAQGERWVALFAGNTSHPDDLNDISSLTLGDLAAFRERARSFDVFGWFSIEGDFNLTSPGAPQHIDGRDVSPSLIAATGAAPIAGRLFSESDGENVALISERLFRQLGAGIVGHAIALSGRSYTVVGAMPGWFRFPLVTVNSRDLIDDVWLPVGRPRDESQIHNYAGYVAYAKLKPGVSFAQAKTDAKQAGAEIQKLYHPLDPTYTAALFSLQDMVSRPIRPILSILLGAAGLLLLIACANVAGLLVSRSVGRARETAIRIALGAGRTQLALQYFLESLLVSLAAATAGVALSVALVRAILSFAAGHIPRAGEISTNWPVIAFAVALAFLTAALSSLAPLAQSVRMQPNEVLSDGVRASAGVRSRKLSQSLVIAEIAVAFTLVSAGAILVWQFNRLKATSPGFDPKNVLTFQITLSARNEAAPAGGPSGLNPATGEAARMSAYQDRLLHSLEAIPGVVEAAVTNQIPLDGCCFSAYILPERRSSDRRTLISIMTVSPGYFEALRIPLLSGRLLTRRDTNEKLVPVVIDAEAARRTWQGQNAVGQFGRFSGPDGTRFEVVGVVGTVQNEGLDQAARPEVYLLMDLAPPNPAKFVVRSALPASVLAPAVRRAVAQVDPTQPVYSTRSLSEVAAGSLFFQRIESMVVSLFAVGALFLAALGVYGLTSYSVRQRTTELGTRMALGATGSDLLRLVIGSGLRLSVFGLVAGAFGATGATILVARYLNVRQIEAWPYLSSVAVIVLFSALASVVPAWRASLLSPMVAIRNESDSVWTVARQTVAKMRDRISAQNPGAGFAPVVLTEFVEASRRAQSFREALEASLMHLRGLLRAESALLLEKVGAGQYRCVAAVPARTEGERFGIPETGFLLNRLRFNRATMLFAADDVQTALRWARAQNRRLVPELELLHALDLSLAAALRTREETIGLLLFGPPEGRAGYDGADRMLAAACAQQFALTLENARLNQRLLEQEKLRRDLALATEVQQRLLPQVLPQWAGGSVDAFTIPARGIGGDYYDFVPVGEHRLGIALADVAGKGIPAALITGVVHASLRLLTDEENLSLPELAAKMNRFLHRSTGSASYATFFYAQLDLSLGPDSRRLRYVNAGHNPPYLVRQFDGNGTNPRQIEELANGGTVIGLLPAATYQEAAVDLGAGDVLMAFTDGVPEAQNSTEEEFGEERLQELLLRSAHLPVREITAAIAGELRAWIGDAPQYDDLTFVVLKVGEEPRVDIDSPG